MQTETEVHNMVETLKGALQYISDTFVNASQLAETVHQVQSELAQVRSSFEGRIQQMQNELDHLRNVNASLEDTITHVRQERDQHQADVGALRSHIAEVEQQLNSTKEELAQARRVVEELTAQLTDTKKAHDEAEYRALHWEDQHNKVKEQLEGVHKALGLPGRAEDGKFTPFPKAVNEQGW